jgi:CheY-like chemotaxis protein
VLSLGVTLWEALAHRRLYGGVPEVQLMLRVCSEEPPTLSRAGVVVDPDLEAIVARALARDRERRFATAADLAAALDDWAARTPSPPTQQALASWLRARFVPRVVTDGVPTQWAFRGTTPSGQAVEELRTLVDARAPPAPAVAAPERPAPLLHDRTEIVPPPPSSSPSPSPSPSSSPPSSPPVAPRRDLVLYVEDEPENREVAELLLQKHFALLLAPDDRAACALLRERGPELAAVLMDIQLKGSVLDGIALVRLLRGAAPTADLPDYARALPPLSVPVFFVTAYSARYGEQELLSVGADKLVTKPVDFAQLTMALTSFSLRRAAALPRHP